MAAPTRGSATTETQLQVNWLALTGSSTGGVALDSFNVEWDSGTNGASWVDLQGQAGAYSLSTTVIANTGVAAGASY
jgi:hypothetical protein